MLNEFTRTELLLGKDGMEILRKARIAVFGIGGVGSYTVEALARCGVGEIDIFDDDKVCLTNLNRQIIATRKSVGKSKVLVMKERILDINPKARVNAYECYLDGSNINDFPFEEYDYIVDAIDTVTSKLLLIQKSIEVNKPIISCMGVGNKLYPEKLEITDIYKTSMCPLAKVMRKELRDRRVKKCKVLFSKEQPIKPYEEEDNSCKTNCVCPPGTKRHCSIRRQVPGSISFVPSVAGLMIAGEVVRNLTGKVS